MKVHLNRSKMRKDTITTYGEDTTNMTSTQVEALAGEEVSPKEVEFFRGLRASEKRILAMPDYPENIAADRRRVA